MAISDASPPNATENLARAGEAAGPSPWLVRQWVVAGVISASSTFVPLPLVDDYLQAKCRRFAVQKTLQAHGLRADADRFEPYYDGSGGIFSGLGSMALKAPLKLALFPIRKPLRLIRSVRDVPLEIVRTVLIGRTLDRFLRARGTEAPNANSPVLDAAIVADLRRAFDRAFARMDFRLLRAATKDAFMASTRLLSALLAARRQSPADGELLNDLQKNPAVEAEAEKVEAQMARPEMLSLFREFDARFDKAFQEVRERRLTREASN
jgi:hypothetical protein